MLVALLPLLVAVTSTSLARAQVAVPFTASVPFTNTSEVAAYTVELGSLPLRPELVVDAVPDAVHGNLELRIELTSFQLAGTPGADYCPAPTDTLASPAGTGPVQLVWPAWRCQPQTGSLVGDTAVVRVRVVDFGSAGPPANVHVALRGVTTVPWGTQLVPYFPPGVQRTVVIPAAKDTTIYERDPTAGSNGAGQYLWAGRDVDTTAPFTPHDVRSLVSFDLRTHPIPSSAAIDQVELQVDVESIFGSGNSLSLWSMGFEGRWDEGDADAAGDELQAGTTSLRAANWLNRGLQDNSDWDWLTPGGGPEELLATQPITTTGVTSFGGAALRDTVELMLGDFYNLSGFQDGFVLRGPETSGTTSGVQLASRENTTPGAKAPALLVTVTQPAGEQVDIGQSGVVTFINEGQNLRWIYDVDQDDVYTSPIGGVCTVTGTTNSGAMPYTYQFTGAPGYTGHDCCTWHVDSPQTGTLGTGQLLFYHNLDTSDPANLPPDTDRDGIRDLCDNCPAVANGPLLGSCRAGPAAGAPCRSNAECSGSGCDLSQEDADKDATGDACVPEPGLGALLAAGVFALAGLGSRRPARGPRGCPHSSPSRRAAARMAASATSRSGSVASHRR